ncbi:MAG TPA: hypothetical protein VGN64_17010 [Dyadobacter sp.]|jgi:hypothetical protein|nr:hypothetical protein [Dyadobacter sp.]
MNKQRFLSGDSFYIENTWYKLSNDGKTLLYDPALENYWLNYATVDNVCDEFVKVTGKFISMNVSFGILFTDMKFPKL